MASLNQVILIGNLTRDPELKYIADGTPVCELGLAVNRPKKSDSKKSDGNGHSEDGVDFIDVVAWGRQAEISAEHLKKGRSVCVSGKLTQQRWTDEKSGQNRSKLVVTARNIQFLGSPKAGSDTAPAHAGAEADEE